MRLPPDQVERFYAIWKSLILFVNRKLKIEPTMLDPGYDRPWDPSKFYPIRQALWKDDSLREAFIAENPAGLSAADLALVKSWDHRVAGRFVIFRHLKKYSVLIGGDPQEVYGVLGLASSLDEVIPFTPAFAEAVLLPFEGRIIFDSLIVPYNIYLGPGIRRGLNETYQDARERGAIITSLEPEPPASPEEERAAAEEVDDRVLEAFRKHLFRSGQSPRIVERDVASAGAFATYLASLPQPHSLRDFSEKELSAYLAVLPSGGREEAKARQSRTGLARLLRFLRDTGRMDYGTASDALDLMKG